MALCLENDKQLIIYIIFDDFFTGGAPCRVTHTVYTESIIHTEEVCKYASSRGVQRGYDTIAVDVCQQW